MFLKVLENKYPILDDKNKFTVALKYGSGRVLNSIDALSSWVLSCQKNKRGCVLNFYEKIKSQTS